MRGKKKSINRQGITKCNNCRSESYKDSPKDWVESITTELERTCIKCGTVMDYWVTGTWESELELSKKA